MSATLDGPPFCSSCGYQDSSGRDSEEELFSNTLLYDASDFDLGDGQVGLDAGATNIMPAARPRKKARSPRPHVPGESIFAPDLQLEPEPSDETPGRPLERPGGRAVLVDQSSATADVPAVREPEPRPRAPAGPPPRGPSRRPRGAEARAGEARPVREEALFLPRCRHCERPLELEEVADGVCGECRRERPKRRRGGFTLRRMVQVTAGTLAACEAIWIGSLVLLSAARSDTSGWQTPEILTLALRLGLVVFAVIAGVAFARDRDWSAGAAVALGPAAFVLAVLLARSGALTGEVAGGGLTRAAAWLAAGAAGALVTLVAVTCFASSDVIPESSILARRRRRSRRASSVSDGDEASSPTSGRAIAGGVVALAGAGLACWQAVLAVLSTGDAKARLNPEQFPSVPQGVPLLQAAALGVATLAALSLAAWLFTGPPSEDTHVGAVAGATVAGALPAWLLLGAFLLKAELARALALVSGAALLFGAGSLFLDTEGVCTLPRATTPHVLVLGAMGSAMGLACGLWVLVGGPTVRGRALAGFSLTSAVVWGAALATATAWA